MSAPLILIRTLHYGALALLVGAFAFLLSVARPSFRRGGPEGQEIFERFDDLLFRLAAWGFLATLLSGVGWFWIQASNMSGKPLSQALALPIVSNVLNRTQFGEVWKIRLALLVLVGGFLLFREKERDEKDWLALRIEHVLLGGGLIVTLAWAGHAAATQGVARLYHLMADSIHLLAVGIWLGGLLPLALLLSQAKRSQHPVLGTVAKEATRRFSALALLSMSGIVLTGIVNSWMIVSDVPHLFGTPYGHLLLIKLSLLIPLMAIAAQNLLRLKPELLATEPLTSPDRQRALIACLRRNVVAEVGLGVSVLIVVGALGITPPARHIQPSWPFSFRLSWGAIQSLPGARSALIAGGAGVLLGAMVLGYGLFQRRHRAWSVGIGALLMGSFALVPLRSLAVDAHPTTYVRPKIQYQVSSIARGAALYSQHCAVCHGPGGRGDGPAAQGLTPKPADLTAKHTQDHTVGDLFWWLTNGIKDTAMPAFKEKLSESDRWDLINFLRALSATEAARSLSPIVEPTPRLVAPDFDYGIGAGENRALRASRGEAVILLVLFALPESRPRLVQLGTLVTPLARMGTQILTVPIGDAEGIYRTLGGPRFLFTVVTEGNQEIVEAYSLFRRSLEAEGVPPPGRHLEFLIDRQGYIRARWLPQEGKGWADPKTLLAEIERLNTEKPGPPAPLEHVH